MPSPLFLKLTAAHIMIRMQVGPYCFDIITYINHEVSEYFFQRMKITHFGVVRAGRDAQGGLRSAKTDDHPNF